MVDFKKRLAQKTLRKPLDPIELYDSLDRAHDKGPLRPAQEYVLKEWFQRRSKDRDVIVKLHTGQGKTLIGLVILQSRLHDSKGPAVYLCPDRFLIDQTCEQARQFGIPTCRAETDLPDAFLDSKAILVTSIQKMFNGLTKFGLHSDSLHVGSFLMDDAHACADRIRDACKISISSEEQAYSSLVTLFAGALELQGVGTFAEITAKRRSAALPVPYWAWIAHETDVATILARAANTNSVKFAWPLLKDMLSHCQCVVSGASIEIEPYVPPLRAFGSYWNAPHRVFMSATVTDDAFLVKGLQLDPEVIVSPLTYSRESWSGEKMVILPSLIDDELNREWIVNHFAPSDSQRKAGTVALTPGFAWTEDWKGYGATVADKETVADAIQQLGDSRYDRTVVLANRYDGIDLPDDMCRILILDSKPHAENLIDSHAEFCRPESEASLVRTIRTIEQGMGRSVRGEKDYSVVIITGTDLTRLIRSKESRQYLSPQMSKQVEIGVEISGMAKSEIEDGEKPDKAFGVVIRQCLSRDVDWKAYYAQQMKSVLPIGANKRILGIYAVELKAEEACHCGNSASAAKAIQQLLDDNVFAKEDKAWYLQEMARYLYRHNRTESRKLQIEAHSQNPLLLKPESGMKLTKLTVVSQKRMERIIAWVRQFEDYSHLDAALSDILNNLVFGSKAPRFERSMNELSSAIGFAGQMTEKEQGAGPDNLWALDDTQYILWECKNEVERTRAAINKDETDQMNKSCAWFAKIYPGSTAKNVIVHPTHKVGRAAAFRYDVGVMRVAELNLLVRRIRDFFKSFSTLNLNDLSVSHVQELIDLHELSVTDFLSDYSKKPKNQG